MRKKRVNGKRVIALALALSMVIGQATMVSADPATDTVQVSVQENPEEDTQDNKGAEVSENDVNQSAENNDAVDSGDADDVSETEDDEDIIADGAYDGSASRVLINNATKCYSSSYNLSNGRQIDYTYVNQYYESVTTLGQAKDYKYGDSNFYLYNGVVYRYYSSNSKYNSVSFNKALDFADGISDNYYNDDTEMYTLNGRVYEYVYDITINGVKKCYADFSNEVIPVGKFDNFKDAENAFGQKMEPEDDYYSYYMIAGNIYMDINYNTTPDGKKYVYAEKDSQISFTAVRVNLTWDKLSNVNVQYTPEGKKIYTGYQVEENGVILNESNITSDGKYVFTGSDSRVCNALLQSGQSARYRVRGFYYYEDEVDTTEGNHLTKINVIDVGEWSDTYTYTAPVVTDRPVVTGVKATVNGSTIDVLWDSVPAAEYYALNCIKSNVPLDGLTADTWNSFSPGGEKYNQVKSANPDAKIVREGTITNSSRARFNKDKDYTYYYYAVYVVVMGNYDLYSSNFKYSQVASVIAPFAVNVPTIQNFKVENKMDGTFDITWSPVDAKVIIYISESPAFPQYYNYQEAYAKVNGSRIYLKAQLDKPASLALDKIKSKEVSGLDGSISSTQLGISLKTGVNYYFVAHTYDRTFINDQKPVPVATIGDIAFNYYMDMSAPSTIISGKLNLVKPVITSASFKNSIQLNLRGENATGFEIYKKSGKKYKKLAITTDNNYLDEKLKENSKYYYRVRSYYYNKDTKGKCYSDFVYITAETSVSNNIVLNVTEKSATSVYLKWSKVTNASKYEIYRSNSVSTNPLVTSKKYNNSDSVATAMHNNRYELIKSVNKASTTKLTDKNLVSGDRYTYIVVAYYKQAGKVEYISGSDSVELYLTTPAKLDAVLKGTTAKVTWEANKYAAKYEIRYDIYDAGGYCMDKISKVASTKKNSYTIKNIPDGGFVAVSVRAYGKDKKYTDWTTKVTVKSLAATSNIKAVNTVQENRNVVKISWKAVKGAKYYMVFRSDKMLVYNADTKKYAVDSNLKLISRFGNDDESTNTEPYKEYLGVTGSVVGTTTYDRAELDNGVTYYYAVVAFGEKGTQICTYLADTFDLYNGSLYYGSGKPAKIVFNATPVVKVKSKKAKKVTLTFAKVPGASNYEIYRSTKKNGSYKKTGSTKKTTYVDKTAKKGKTYYYKVVAKGTNALKANYCSESNVVKVKAK